MLTRKGVTAWSTALADLTMAAAGPIPASPASGTGPCGPPALPARLTSELVSVLAGLALA